MTAQRATLPSVLIGQSFEVPEIGRTEAAGGRVYFIRWGASTALDFGLDPVTGRGVHARIMRTAYGEFCGVSPVGGVSIDTDFGDRAIIYPGAPDAVPLMMPHWDVDFDSGIYIPHDMTAQIALLGGDPDSTARAWPVFHSRRLQPWERPPPLRATYQNAPPGLDVILVDSIAGSDITEADLRGAVSVMCPENGLIALSVQLWYNASGSDSRTIAVLPGVPISLTGAWKVTLIDGGHWEFGIEL